MQSEEAKHKVKPNNEAKIIWADSNHQQTDYAIVYLHGFSASQMEGDPVHRNIAKQFHCNLYSRLSFLLLLWHSQEATSHNRKELSSILDTLFADIEEEI